MKMTPNSIKKSVVVCLLFLLNLFVLAAQNPIILRGYVQDSTGAPLPFVNIFTQQSDSSPIIAFGVTNDKGYFSFSTPRPLILLVKATFLGFRAASIVLYEKDKIPDNLTFTLQPYDVVLKEAIVRAKIIEKSDTITFKADAFRDSTERNLEELLVKIPGVSVDKNTGSISVQGNPIKKILIEGDDLTGHNYQLMSKNLAADVIDKVQIINKFNENRLLKGLRKSDDMVINITLKDARKKLLFGNVIAGLGTSERTNNAVNLLGFYKKLKTITFGNYNTVGQTPTADMMMGQDFKEEDPAQQQRAIVNERTFTIINNNRMPFLSLNNRYIRFNKTTLGSTHFVIRPREIMRIKGGMTLSADDNQIFTSNAYRYLLRDSIFELNETNVFERKPLVFQSNLEIQVDLSAKALMRYNGFYRQSNLRSDNQTLSNRNAIRNDLTDKTTYFSNTLDFTYRIDDTKAVVINAFQSRENGNQIFVAQQMFPRYIPSVKIPLGSVHQTIDKPMNYVVINGQLFFSNDNRKVALGGGFVARSENLKSNFYGIDTLFSPNIIEADSLKNDFQFNQRNYYAHLNWSETWRNVQLFTDISGGFYQPRVADDSKKNQGYILPTAGFRKQTERYKLFCTYNFNFSIPQITDVTTGLILTDYRSFQRGNSLLIPANSHTIIANYVYGKISDKFMAHLNFIGAQTNKGYRDNLTIGNDFNTSEKVPNEFKNINLVFSGGVERYFSKISSRLKIKPTVSFVTYQNQLNNSDVRQTNINANSVDISLRSGFLKWFNYHIGTTLMQSTVTFQSLGIESVLKNQTIGSFIDLYFTVSPRLKMKYNIEHFYVKQGTLSPRSYYFINSSLDYDIIRSRLSCSLTGRNLFNNKELINANISDVSTNISTVRLIPRFVLLEINFRF